MNFVSKMKPFSLSNNYNFIECEKNTTSLIFQDQTKKTRFELGVCLVLHGWDELETAVDNSWGGNNSDDKRDWLSAIIVELFNQKEIDTDVIEETLNNAMIDEFNTEICNNSIIEISNCILKVYDDVKNNNYDFIDYMYKKWQIKQKSMNRNTKKINFANDDDSSSDYIENDIENNTDETHDFVIPPLIDEHGFQLVQKKKNY